MRKIVITLVGVLFLVGTLSLIMADSFSGSSEVFLGRPQDPALVREAEQSLNEDVSNLDIFKARIGLWFTFNKEKRVEKELKLASMLLNRARIAAKKNDSEAMEKAIQEHNRLMERIRQRVEDMSRQNFSSEKLRGIDRAIQVHEIKIERFNQRLQNENLSEKQRENIERMLNNSQKSLEVLRQLKELKEERNEIRERVRSEMRSKKENITKRIEDNRNFSEQRVAKIREQSRERVREKN